MRHPLPITLLVLVFFVSGCRAQTIKVEDQATDGAPSISIAAKCADRRLPSWIVPSVRCEIARRVGDDTRFVAMGATAGRRALVFSPLEPGRYVLSAHGEGLPESRFDLELGAGRLLAVKLEVPPLGASRGDTADTKGRYAVLAADVVCFVLYMGLEAARCYNFSR